MPRATKGTWCGHLALPKFRRQAEGMMVSCVCEPDHAGNHVYCVKVKAGIDHPSHALQYFEEISRTELKPVMNVDMDGTTLSSDEECAFVWQFFEYHRFKYHRRSRLGEQEGT